MSIGDINIFVLFPLFPLKEPKKKKQSTISEKKVKQLKNMKVEQRAYINVERVKNEITSQC